jgi:16S rRNA (guanine527-N7)-methyltransferase
LEPRLRETLVDGANRLGIALGSEALARFETYLALLQQWGRKINLTSRLEAEEVVTHHFLDSLAGVPLLAPTPAAGVVDIGTGAGLPGFPLKFALPGLRVTLIDSVRKKVAFCQEVIRATGVSGVDAAWGRAEDLVRERGRGNGYDWVVSRALAQAADIVKLGLPYLAPGGRLLLYKGRPDERELEALEALCAKLGASLEVRAAIVPFLDEARSLLIIRTGSQGSPSASSR